MSILRDLFDHYKCDKGYKHQYHTVYERYLDPIRNKKVNILELGVFKGASAASFCEYLPDAEIYGIDLFERVRLGAAISGPRIHYLRGDTQGNAIREQVKDAWPRIRFDVIIDDAQHTPDANLATFKNFYPLLKKNGVYFIEDVWPLDKMSPLDMQHPWIKRYASVYTLNSFTTFHNKIAEIAGSDNIKRYDLRSLTKEPDSYIYRIKNAVASTDAVAD